MIRKALIFSLLGATAFAVQAAPDLLQTAPLQARAKSVELDQKTGATRYRGDVQISLGRLHVRADYLEAFYRDRQLSEVRGRGAPLILRRDEADTEPEIEVHAKRLEYRLNAGQIQFFDDVSMRQGDDVLYAHAARYELATRHFEATGDPEQGQRVLATYHPRRPTDGTP